MSIETQERIVSDDTAALGFDPGVLREKYREERDKRLRADANAQYVEVAGDFRHYVDDPYIEAPIDRAPLTDTVDALVIGGGFGGLLAAARLREVGVETIRILEKGGDFGGTWYWNRYPGAQCDIESYIYLPLLEETGYVPREKYSFAQEIREHSRRIGEHYDLYKDACFQTEIRELRWLEDEKLWLATTNRDDAMKARWVVMSNGPLNRPKLPGIPGIETFKGHSFHTSRWDYGYTGGNSYGNLDRLTDKTVAIIGTGATAIQCVPHLGAAAKQLYVFQRTPSSVDLAGAGGNVKYYSPAISYRQFWPMKGLRVNREGHNVLGFRTQFAHVAGFGGEVAPPTNRIYGGGESDVRGFDVRANSPYVFIPNRVQFNLTNPDGSTVPLEPYEFRASGNVTIPLPVYRLVSIGGDTQITSNVEYRIPIVNQVTFALFTDFGMTMSLQGNQLKQSAAGLSTISSPSYGCPTIVNGACFGGQHVRLSAVPEHGSRHQLCAAHVQRRGDSGHPAHRQRALPHLLRLQSATALQGSAPAACAPPDRGGRAAELPGTLPQHQRGTVYLPAGRPVLRRGLHFARTSQDLPAYRQHHLLACQVRVQVQVRIWVPHVSLPRHGMDRLKPSGFAMVNGLRRRPAYGNRNGLLPQPWVPSPQRHGSRVLPWRAPTPRRCRRSGRRGYRQSALRGRSR